ncbi:hypothetical protein RRG08_031082 [Elysia crispata]|uniref:FZ domain-containing protein n=1 Tax=Elysia crispata TaxID=231223 RepID=A0AAE0ZFD0_9GAST|nr:hypothetical protein RRG08_031082 [Elysia crispata]
MAFSNIVKLFVFLVMVVSAQEGPSGPGGSRGPGGPGGPGGPRGPGGPGGAERRPGGRPSVSMCAPFSSKFCESLSYETAGFPNLVGHKTSGQANATLASLLPLVQSGCSPLLQDFLCGVHFPECHESQIIVPCRSLCSEVNKSCLDTMTKMGFRWPQRIRCSVFPVDGDGDCFGKDLPGKTTDKKPVVTPEISGNKVNPTPPSSQVDQRKGVDLGTVAGMLANPIVEWLKSSTDLNKRRSELTVEEVKVVKLTKQKLQLEIEELKRMLELLMSFFHE